MFQPEATLARESAWLLQEEEKRANFPKSSNCQALFILTLYKSVHWSSYSYEFCKYQRYNDA